jgi:hypothetical protein
MTGGITTVTLHDGRTLEIDLHRVTLREFRSIFAPEQQQAEEDRIIAKACGLDVDVYLDLPQPDARRVILEFLAAASQPLKDPNSPSASTSA